MTALDAAIAAHMAHPAGSLSDGLTDSQCDQALWSTLPAAPHQTPAAQPAPFEPTALMPTPESEQTLKAAVRLAAGRAARQAYVQGVRAGRLAGFAWGLVAGAGGIAAALHLGLLAGG